MLYNITPKTEEMLHLERQEMILLLEKGWYECEFISAEGKINKSGNPMIVAKISIKVPGEQSSIKTDHIVIADWSQYKIRHLCEMCGIVNLYDSGKFSDEDLKPNSKGYCYIKQQKENVGADGRFYDRQNSISDYSLSTPKGGLVTQPFKTSDTQEESAPFKDDDIPF